MDGLIILVLISTVTILFTVQKVSGVDHNVQGWKIIAANASSFTTSKMVFTVGDGLVFKMGAGEADIAQVSMSGYDLCNAEVPKALYRAGSTAATIYLNRIGNWYFISRAPDHCKSGKKLKITVVAKHNNTRENNNNNRVGFRFRETSHRMGFGGGGRGGGRPVYSIPKGYKNRLPTRGRSRSCSAPRLFAVDFKSLGMTVFPLLLDDELPRGIPKGVCKKLRDLLDAITDS